MSACLFCQIATGERPATIVYRGDGLIAIRDIHPQAPTHILIIPTKHIVSVAEATAEDAELDRADDHRRHSNRAARESE